MLEHEYRLLEERLAESRGDRTAFFVFADTVTTQTSRGGSDAHGWLGIRFQVHPREQPNDILLHVRMWDKDRVQQQEALGIIGVNFVYGAFYYRMSPDRFIRSLADSLGVDRIEVDMLKFTGPAFAQVDNRLLSLLLVKTGLTNAVMFGPDGDVLQPSEVLHRKAILVERGSFRPVTRVNVDMLGCATTQFLQEPAVKGKPVMVLMEITMNNLLAAGRLDAEDFLARVDLLGAIGYTVLISNYPEFYRLTSYFRRYTKEMIGVALGINTRASRAASSSRSAGSSAIRSSFTSIRCARRPTTATSPPATTPSPPPCPRPTPLSRPTPCGSCRICSISTPTCWKTTTSRTSPAATRPV